MKTPADARNADSRFPNPVFVVGVYRSGTSLLHTLLNQHPQMALMYEFDVWAFPDTLSKLRFRGNWLERQEFYNQALSRHRLVFGGRLSGLEKADTPDEIYTTFSQGRHATLWGEKSPFYGTRLQRLAKRYPECSFILIWRDPIEIYRSILDAARKDKFFRQRGMLSRLIWYQEAMIREATELERAGGRIHHVTYNGLIDRRESVCRNICQFLEIEFDSQMLGLEHADFSSLSSAPHHDHLRGGVIERRHLSNDIMPRRTLEKLRRFHNRWYRLNDSWFDCASSPHARQEPSPLEHLYHRVAGSLLITMDEARRALFEFLPLTWLRTYRQTAPWLFRRRHSAAAESATFPQVVSEHWITILVSFGLLAAVGIVDFLTGPDVVLAPFYIIPCAALTLILNCRWGTLATVCCALILTALGTIWAASPLPTGVVLWNVSMRFLLFQVTVLLLDRIRTQVSLNAGQQQE